LVKLNEIEWSVVGAPTNIIDDFIAKRTKAVQDGSKSETSLKRLAAHKEILLSVNKMIQLSDAERKFFSMGNVLQSNFGSWFKELSHFGMKAYVMVGERPSLEYAQNPWVAKVTPWQVYTHSLETRYTKIFNLLAYKVAGSVVPPDDALIADIHAANHDPRYWCTWVDPRKALKCRNPHGVALTSQDKETILGWVASSEMAIIKLARMTPVEFTLDRFDNGLKTPYWKQLTDAYQLLNDRILKVKNVASGFVTYLPWNDTPVSYSSPNWYTDNARDESTFVDDSAGGDDDSTNAFGDSSNSSAAPTTTSSTAASTTTTTSNVTTSTTSQVAPAQTAPVASNQVQQQQPQQQPQYHQVQVQQNTNVSGGNPNPSKKGRRSQANTPQGGGNKNQNNKKL